MVMDDYLCEKLISFVPERSVPEMDSMKVDDRRPKRKARATKFDDDEGLYDGGELVVGFNLLPVKTGIHIGDDDADFQLAQLQVVQDNGVSVWRPDADWKGSLKSSCDAFDSKIATRSKAREIDYDLILHELQTSPKFDHYLEKFSYIWRGINNLGEKQVQDDILVMDKWNMLRTKKNMDAEEPRRVVKRIKKDKRRIRKRTKQEMKKRGFVYTKESTQRLPTPSTVISEMLPASKLVVTETLFESDTDREEDVKDNIQPSPSSFVVTEMQFENDTDREEVQDGMSSGGSVIGDNPLMMLAAKEKLQDEAPSQAPIEEPEPISHLVPTFPDLYKNIPEAVIKRGVAINKDIEQCTQSALDVLKLYEVIDKKVFDGACNLNQALNSQSVGTLKRKASEDLINEVKRKLVKENSRENVVDCVQKAGLSRDDFAAVLQKSCDKALTSMSFDDDIICIDEYSEQALPGHERFNEGFTWVAKTRKGVPWKMYKFSPDVLPNRTYAQRLSAYNLPALDPQYFANLGNKAPRTSCIKIPLTSENERIVQVQRKNNEDRCAIFLDLGLKSRNIGEVALYDKLYHGLSIEDQQSYNNLPELTAAEKLFSGNHVIPQYGSVPLVNFKFPTSDPYEGLYWPLFQPIDDIPFTDDETTNEKLYNADVQNQIVNQTVCNYEAKRYLLCDDGIGSWNSAYKEGCSTYDEKQKGIIGKNGRFKNRVCFARNLPSQEVKTRNLNAREINRKNEEEYRKEIERKKEAQKQEFLRKKGINEDEAVSGTFLDKEHEREYYEAMFSTTLSEQLRAYSVDTYSLIRCHGRRRASRYPSTWVEVPFDEYVPANDRRTFLCQYINHYNEHVIEHMPRPDANMEIHDRYIEQLAKWIAGAFTATFAFQYDKEKRFSRLAQENKKESYSHFQFAEGRRLRLDQKFPRGSTIKLQELETFCKMESWEWEYWPLIWDSLSSIYRRMPPISQLVPLMADEIHCAFSAIAKSELRRKFYLRYTARKNDHLYG